MKIPINPIQYITSTKFIAEITLEFDAILGNEIDTLVHAL